MEAVVVFGYVVGMLYLLALNLRIVFEDVNCSTIII